MTLSDDDTPPPGVPTIKRRRLNQETRITLAVVAGFVTVIAAAATDPWLLVLLAMIPMLLFAGW